MGQVHLVLNTHCICQARLLHFPLYTVVHPFEDKIICTFSHPGSNIVSLIVKLKKTKTEA